MKDRVWSHISNLFHAVVSTNPIGAELAASWEIAVDKSLTMMLQNNPETGELRIQLELSTDAGLSIVQTGLKLYEAKTTWYKWVAEYL